MFISLKIISTVAGRLTLLQLFQSKQLFSHFFIFMEGVRDLKQAAKIPGITNSSWFLSWPQGRDRFGIGRHFHCQILAAPLQCLL
jgi:hypothetical protein